MPEDLPPGPRLPQLLQTIAWWNRTVPFLERCRERYGKRFTMRLLQAPPFVHHSEPDHLREIFTAPPEVLHPGEGAKLLEPVVGSNSVILLDERAHLSQRKLMLPAFHGEKMQRLSGLMREVTEREVERWPRDQPIQLHPRLQALTLEIILRAVFGLDSGERLDAMRGRLTGILEFGARPASTLPLLQRGRRWREFVRGRAEADAMIYEQIDERRANGGDAHAGAGGTAPGSANGDRDDVLAMLLDARHEDGSPMSPVELRDELMTLLVAGHETTASELAWAFERLTRTPEVLARLAEEIDSGDDDAYVTATVHETLRRRPVLPNAAPRLVMEPVDVGGWRYEPGVCLRGAGPQRAGARRTRGRGSAPSEHHAQPASGQPRCAPRPPPGASARRRLAVDPNELAWPRRLDVQLALGVGRRLVGRPVSGQSAFQTPFGETATPPHSGRASCAATRLGPSPGCPSANATMRSSTIRGSWFGIAGRPR